MKENAKNDLNKNNRKGKYAIKNLPRFLAFISVLIIVLVIIIILIINHKIKIEDDTQIDRLNADKYSQEILAEYNKAGEKEKFLKDYDMVQTQIGLYILNNSTIEENSFATIQQKLQEELNKKDWKEFELEKPTHWNGKWIVDDTGNVKFQFQTKKIEPSWIQDDDVATKVIRNK